MTRHAMRNAINHLGNSLRSRLACALAAALAIGFAAVAEEYPVLVNYPGDVGKQGWHLTGSEAGKIVYIPFEGYYESKGGRIEGPKFTFDKKEGETAFYQLTYTAKSRSTGYWWCDFFDKNDQLLPDINSRLYLDNEWHTYTVQFPCDPRAVKGQLAFVASKGCTVKDVSLRRVSVETAAKWCDDFYKTLPQVKMDVPDDPFHYLPKTRKALQEGRKLRVVLLGDSIVNDTYCGCFTALVMRDFPNVEFIISVRGSTGVYYYHEAEHFEDYCAKYKPDLVMIGGISNHASTNYDVIQDNMEETIDRCRAIGAEVLVMTPPPSYEWRWSSQQTEWNENFSCWAYQKWLKNMQFWTPMWQAYQRKACANKQVALWDVTTGPANTISYSRKPLGWFKRDGAHNDDRGKQLIGQLLAAHFRKAKTLPAKPAFRAPAVPLFVNDPLFSVWARGETLTSADTTNWECWKEHNPDFNSSKEPAWIYSKAPFGIKVQIGDRGYRLCGRDPQSVAAMPQVSCEVRPLSSVYRFADDRTDLELSFQTPFLPDDLDAFSRPVSYVTVKAVQTDGVKRAVTVQVTAGGEVCSDDPCAEVASEAKSGAYGTAVRLGRVRQNPYVCAARPTWGHLWLVAPKGGIALPNMIATPAGEQRASVAWTVPAAAESETTGAVAYEYGDKAGQFLGKDLKGWWARDGKTFETMLAEAMGGFPQLAKKMAAFDARLTADLKRIGGEKYADLATLAYRQSYGACKLFQGAKGESYLCSKENGSGSMISTTDVLYPQFPLMLVTSVELAKATLRPGLDYAASGKWPYAYAPHDLGLYPCMNGQHYAMGSGHHWSGKDTDDSCRMPVEECGNMLICLAAVAKQDGNADFAAQWWPTVTKWAEYLTKFGFDPADQLCTDDFAGHLAHNANLSIKAIMGLQSYAMLAEMKGDKAAAEKFGRIAKESVPKWMEAAKGGAEGGYRLAFDREGTWSMKYNLVWDRLLGFNLFPASVAEAEMKTYRAKSLAFGLPLDSRSNYTKSDWIMWTATLTGNKADFDMLVNPLWEAVDKTTDRVPMTDWYWADTAKFRGFKARSVVGGYFMPAYADSIGKWRK